MTSTRSAAAVATTAAFAAELTQAATARSRRRPASSQEVLEAFRHCGPATGAVSFATEILSSALVTSLALTSARRRRRESTRWARGAASMAGTVALLPRHFARANRKLMDRDFPAPRHPPSSPGGAGGTSPAPHSPSSPPARRPPTTRLPDPTRRPVPLRPRSVAN